MGSHSTATNLVVELFPTTTTLQTTYKKRRQKKREYIKKGEEKITSRSIKETVGERRGVIISIHSVTARMMRR